MLSPCLFKSRVASFYILVREDKVKKESLSQEFSDALFEVGLLFPLFCVVVSELLWLKYGSWIELDGEAAVLNLGLFLFFINFGYLKYHVLPVKNSVFFVIIISISILTHVIARLL
jgi:hypothetical protein